MHRNQYVFWRQMRQGQHNATENCPALDDEVVMSTIVTDHTVIMYDHGKKWPVAVETCILSTLSGI